MATVSGGEAGGDGVQVRGGVGCSGGVGSAEVEALGAAAY